jgi:hypothetical protein
MQIDDYHITRGNNMSVISEKVSRSSWTLFENVKDVVSQNIATAAKQGHVTIDAKSLDKLITIVAASLDEGYHRGHKAFITAVENAVQESVSTVPAKKK